MHKSVAKSFWISVEPISKAKRIPSQPFRWSTPQTPLGPFWSIPKIPFSNRLPRWSHFKYPLVNHIKFVTTHLNFFFLSLPIILANGKNLHPFCSQKKRNGKSSLLLSYFSLLSPPRACPSRPPSAPIPGPLAWTAAPVSPALPPSPSGPSRDAPAQLAQAL